MRLIATMFLSAALVAGCGGGDKMAPPPDSAVGSGGAVGTGGSGGGAGGTGGAPATPDATATGGSAAADAAPPASDVAVPADAGSPSEAGGTAALEKIFDGTSFDNWVYNPTAWKLVDGAMVGKVTGGQSQAFTKKDYGNFRLIVWSRMVNGNDHLGVCFWGTRPAAGGYGFGGCLLVIPPNGAIWDYLQNKDNPKPDYQVGMADWHQTEILANRTTGHVLVAVNGKLVHDYQDAPAVLARRKMVGPVGMQIHKAGTESEYKDISIEENPTSDQLLTLKP
jgi:hypothetical protein